MANALIQFRVDEELKEQATKLYDELGLDLPTAFRIFLKKSVAEGGIPFEVRIDKKEYRSDKGWQLATMLGEEANRYGVADMSLEEINEEIRAARREREIREGR